MTDENTLLTTEAPDEVAADGLPDDEDALPETAPEANADGAEKPAADAVPEQYEFQPPEGLEYDPETMKVYAAAAREAGLSQEKADLILNKLAPHLAQQQQEAVLAVREKWATDARSDQEFGGDALQQNLAVAVKAMEKLGTPELRSLLNDSGLGNHPEIIRVFYRAGKAMAQDGFVGGTKADSGGGDARSHFPRSNMNP